MDKEAKDEDCRIRKERSKRRRRGERNTKKRREGDLTLRVDRWKEGGVGGGTMRQR